MPDIEMNTESSDTGMKLTSPNFKLWMTSDGHLRLESTQGGRVEITPDGKMYVGTNNGDLVKMLYDTIQMLMTHTHGGLMPPPTPTLDVAADAALLEVMKM